MMIEVYYRDGTVVEHNIAYLENGKAAFLYCGDDDIDQWVTGAVGDKRFHVDEGYWPLIGATELNLILDTEEKIERDTR